MKKPTTHSASGISFSLLILVLSTHFVDHIKNPREGKSEFVLSFYTACIYERVDGRIKNKRRRHNSISDARSNC